MLTLTSASLMDDSDLVSAIISFRKFSGCESKIIVSAIQEPNLEPKLIVITILTLGFEEKVVLQKTGFWSGLAVHFPFLSFLIGKDVSELGTNLVVSSSSGSSVDILSDGTTISQEDCINGIANYLDSSSEEMENKVYAEELNSASTDESSNKKNDVSEGTVGSRNPGSEDSNDLGFHIAQQWAKERASVDLTNLVDETERFTLPVGVKTSSPCPDHSPYAGHPHTGVVDDMNSTRVLFDAKTVGPIEALAHTGFEAVQEMYKSALTFIKGKNVDETRSGRLLSARAAAMLEAERELEKSWGPTVIVQYRGGNYRGRCQGGLPEGKGRLMFADGSFYDGMWRNGKRCGVGMLFYGNGDVYQGSWRDDLMHGKGWFYFRTGDRWFANFWKGKANGEGRFYSKNGSIFFGHFKDGWRHGQFLYIDIDGSRWSEAWDEGALISRTQLDKDA